jgi:hypothetical protein
VVSENVEARGYESDWGSAHRNGQGSALASFTNKDASFTTQKSPQAFLRGVAAAQTLRPLWAALCGL